MSRAGSFTARTARTAVLVLVIVALSIPFAQTAAVAQDAPLSEAVLISWSDAAGAGFEKITERRSVGETNEAVNPVLVEDSDGTVSAVVAQYWGPVAADGSGSEYKVTVDTGACVGCLDKLAVEQQFLAGSTDPTVFHWEGHPEFCFWRDGLVEAGAVMWPCVQEHRLAGGLIGLEVYGYSFYDRNAGSSESTLTAVAGDFKVVVEATALKYGYYTPELQTELRDTSRRLLDLYVAHLVGISGGPAASGVVPSVPTIPADQLAPVMVIGALAAVAAIAVTAVAGSAGSAVVAGVGGSAGPAGTGLSSVAPPPPPPLPTLVDPDTGEMLPVDGGQVWIGEWMPHAKAQAIIDSRIEEIALDLEAAVVHQKFVITQQNNQVSQLLDQGFTFDPQSNTWKPGPNTLKILDQQWQDKVNQDPAWLASQEQVKETQALIDAQKDWLKKRWEADNVALQAQHDSAMATDANLAKVVNLVGGVRWTADQTINLLGEIPGAGRTTKWVYNSLTAFIDTGYGVDINTNEPPKGFWAGLEAGGLKLAKDVMLDKLGDKISLQKLSGGRVGDDVWSQPFWDLNGSDGVTGFMKSIRVSNVPLKRLVNATGTKEVVNLVSNRLKSKTLSGIVSMAGPGTP